MVGVVGVVRVVVVVRNGVVGVVDVVLLVVEGLCAGGVDDLVADNSCIRPIRLGFLQTEIRIRTSLLSN